MDIKKYIAETIFSVLDDSFSATCPAASNIEEALSTPPDRKMGDFALPCFKLKRGMNPAIVAGEIKEKLEISGKDISMIENIQVAGGYLNFFLDRKKIANDVISEVLSKGENFGRTEEGSGKTVLVEFSSPNIAKPFHIGHLCSTAIGSSLARIYDFLGYKTVKINHLGDWGTQFGKLISAYKRWGDREVILADPINELLKIYVKFHAEAKEHPELEDEARHYFNLLENNDEEVTALWKFFVEASMKEFNRMYKMLDISFDSFAGESFYSDKMPEIVEILDKKNLLEESEGAKVVRFEDPNMPPCIILKSDGSTIYATRDLAAAVYRKRHYDFYKNIYVVGTPQTLHFKQVFSVLDKMGFDWADSCKHVGFGYVRFPDRALSTRNGDVVLLEDVLNESIAKTKEIITNNGTAAQMDNFEDSAEKIGVGAILFDFLKNGRERDIIFDLNKILDFEGESGPYVQYTYARGRSMLRKAAEMDVDTSNADLSLLTTDEEYALIKQLNCFTDAIKDSSRKYEPYIVTRYVIELAKCFNKFYTTCRCINAEPEIRNARLKLCEASCTVIKSALHLIGVNVVEKM